MDMGFMTAILADSTFEQVLDFASENDFRCLEVACWPASVGAERRYAGVSHIDVENLGESEAARIKALCKEKDIEISSLAYYPNVMDGDGAKRDAAIGHLKSVIRASRLLGVNMVTTFLGRDQNLSVEENLEIIPEVWNPILALAEELDVFIALENCPMLFGRDQWPGGQNLMTSPGNWKKVFSILKSGNLGLLYDPSHFVWQMIDYLKPLYEFKDRIFRVHFKDIKVHKSKLDEVGIMAYPLDFMEPKLPGLGDVDWGKFVSALTDIGYDGPVCIEVEDWAFEGSSQKILNSIKLSKKYMNQFVI